MGIEPISTRSTIEQPSQQLHGATCGRRTGIEPAVPGPQPDPFTSRVTPPYGWNRGESHPNARACKARLRPARTIPRQVWKESNLRDAVLETARLSRAQTYGTSYTL